MLCTKCGHSTCQCSPETPEERFDRVWAGVTKQFKAYVMAQYYSGVEMDRMMYKPELHIFNSKEHRDREMAQKLAESCNLYLAV